MIFEKKKTLTISCKQKTNILNIKIDNKYINTSKKK